MLFTAADSSVPVEFVGESSAKWRLQRVKVLGKGSYGIAFLVRDTATDQLLVAKEVNLQCVKSTKEAEGIHRTRRSRCLTGSLC